jgi:hypothetical protein
MVGNESQNTEGYLHGEGFVSDSLGLLPKQKAHHAERVDGLDTFRDCLFQVTRQLDYQAGLTLVKARAQGCSKQHELVLEDRAHMERAGNDEVLRDPGPGAPVTFGAVVQLRHLKSGKFLSCSPGSMASVQKHHTRLRLKRGSEAAWFSMRPRFKNRAEGAQIYIGDQLTLRHEKSGMKLHSSSVSEGNHYPHDLFERVEVNMANDGDSDSDSGWKLHLHQKGFVGASGFLRLGDAVRLYFPDAESFITGSVNTSKESPVYLQRQMHPDCRSPENHTPKQIFVVEGSGPVGSGSRDGAHVDWRGQYRLRHLASGAFLTVLPGQAGGGGSGDSSGHGHGHAGGKVHAKIDAKVTLGKLKNAGKDGVRSLFQFHRVGRHGGAGGGGGGYAGDRRLGRDARAEGGGVGGGLQGSQLRRNGLRLLDRDAGGSEAVALQLHLSHRVPRDKVQDGGLVSSQDEDNEDGDEFDVGEEMMCWLHNTNKPKQAATEHGGAHADRARSPGVSDAGANGLPRNPMGAGGANAPAGPVRTATAARSQGGSKRGGMHVDFCLAKLDQDSVLVLPVSEEELRSVRRSAWPKQGVCARSQQLMLLPHPNQPCYSALRVPC